MSNTIELTKENFTALVIESKTPVLVDFWASWCGPCKMLSPVVEELAEEFAGRLTVGKVNVDEQGELAAQYGIMSIPSLFVFKNGELLERKVGFIPKNEMQTAIQAIL